MVARDMVARDIVARDQVSLGAAKALRLALDGMSYRMFRSGVTVAILALAVAFLVHVLSYGLLSHATEQSCRRELAAERTLGQLVTRLTRADARASVESALSRGEPARREEYARWSPEVRDRLERAGRIAADLGRAAAYVEGLPPAARAVLLGDASALELFAGLDDPAQLQTFERRLASLGVFAPLGDAASFRRLVMTERRELDQVIDQVVAGHLSAVERLRSAYPKTELSELAVDPAPGFYDTVRKLGFVLPAAPEELREFTRRERDLKVIQRLLLTDSARAAAARELDLGLSDVSFGVVADAVRDVEDARWLAAALSSAGSPRHFEPERLRELMESHRRERRLEAVAAEAEPAPESGLLGASSEDRWLIVLSFVVCVVGVANAMLMSVTERFTEIATMKCLGALDRFIMAMFLFEAVVQGVVGGLSGVILGIALAALRGLVEFGTLFSRGLAAAAEVGTGVFVSLAVGVLLAMLAAVGPAFLAARLSPMEAMRVE
ncbi:MAG TPA: ABC transporter permease [Polyangiaceae bacterium]